MKKTVLMALVITDNNDDNSDTVDKNSTGTFFNEEGIK